MFEATSSFALPHTPLVQESRGLQCATQCAWEIREETVADSRPQCLLRILTTTFLLSEQNDEIVMLEHMRIFPFNWK